MFKIHFRVDSSDHLLESLHTRYVHLVLLGSVSNIQNHYSKAGMAPAAFPGSIQKFQRLRSMFVASAVISQNCGVHLAQKKACLRLHVLSLSQICGIDLVLRKTCVGLHVLWFLESAIPICSVRSLLNACHLFSRICDPDLVLKR
jgi:hypothetical protein